MGAWTRTVLRKGLVLVVGSVIVVAGLLMVVLPGPGWLTVFAGLALLGREFAWARRANDRLKAVVSRGWQTAKRLGRRARRRPAPEVVLAPRVVDLTDAAPVQRSAPDATDDRRLAARQPCGPAA
jgi:uncharacterized protein (TIGR02611 family)